jgi:uncharacterized damage-inducible protein DinB
LLKELENYLLRLEDLHKQVIAVIHEVPGDGLNFTPIVIPDLQVSNSLAALAVHIAGAEHYWIGEVVAGLMPTRDRAAEFKTKVRFSAELVTRLKNAYAESNTILARLTEADLEKIRKVEDHDVPVRWAILHVIDHTALHLGQMQLTYQLWAKGDSKPSPFWFSRLPPR